MRWSSRRLAVFFVTALAVGVAGCETIGGEPSRPSPPGQSPERHASDKPSDRLLGDWVLKSVEGKTSCTIKLQSLQGYGYGQVWKQSSCRFDDVPTIFSWRFEDGSILLQGQHGRGDVGSLHRAGRDTFRGALVSGEKVTMARK